MFKQRGLPSLSIDQPPSSADRPRPQVFCKSNLGRRFASHSCRRQLPSSHRGLSPTRNFGGGGFIVLSSGAEGGEVDRPEKFVRAKSWPIGNRRAVGLQHSPIRPSFVVRVSRMKNGGVLLDGKYRAVGRP
jgi:hypothetical protein